jgi:hypothetical protein
MRFVFKTTNMNIIIVSLIGIVSTVIMTAFAMLGYSFKGYCLEIPRLLGYMIMTIGNSKYTDFVYGSLFGQLTHYLFGVLWASLYFLLKQENFNLLSGLIFGTIAGAIATTVWYLFIQNHPRPPQLSLKFFLLIIFISHIIFGISSAFFFEILLQH